MGLSLLSNQLLRFGSAQVLVGTAPATYQIRSARKCATRQQQQRIGFRGAGGAGIDDACHGAEGRRISAEFSNSEHGLQELAAGYASAGKSQKIPVSYRCRRTRREERLGHG